MRASRFIIAAFFCTCLVPQATLSQPVGGTEFKYNSLRATESATFKLSELSQITAIKQNYEVLFRRNLTYPALREEKEQHLNWLYKAAYLAAFYSQEDRYLSDLRMILAELEQRNTANAEQRATFYRALIGFRRFDEARSYLAQHPSLGVEPVPAIERNKSTNSGEVLVYRVDDQQFKLVEQKLDVARGTHLVVVSHPLCAFSRSIMLAAETDPHLAALIGENVVWLAPVDMRLHFDVLQDWNHAHPSVNVVLPRQRRDWPMIESWSTPQFYLLRDGAVIDHFSGWRQDGSSQDRLLKMLTTGGLLSIPDAVTATKKASPSS